MWGLGLTTIALALVLLVLGAQVNSDDAAPPKALLETGQAAKVNAPTATGEVTVVSYNIRWRTGAELDQVAAWLKSQNAAIIGLQEVDRGKKRTGKINNARALAESLGMFYAWAAPPVTKQSEEEETGVELLSSFPLTDITPMVLPQKGPGGRWRAALGATVKIGKTTLRVYSVHSETRISLKQKLDQYRAVLEDLKKFPLATPAVVMGDFNSWEPPVVDAIRKLFTEQGFSTPFADNESTFKRSAVLFDIKLKLDWIWLRGLSAKTSAIDRRLTVSDHFPLWTIVSEPSATKSQSSSSR